MLHNSLHFEKTWYIIVNAYFWQLKFVLNHVKRFFDLSCFSWANKSALGTKMALKNDVPCRKKLANYSRAEAKQMCNFLI